MELMKVIHKPLDHTSDVALVSDGRFANAIHNSRILCLTAMQVKCDKAEIFQVGKRNITNQKMIDNWGNAKITLPRHY